MLKDHEKEGCKIVFEPPRLPSSEIIARIVERAIMRKAKLLKYFADWNKDIKIGS